MPWREQKFEIGLLFLEFGAQFEDEAAQVFEESLLNGAEVLLGRGAVHDGDSDKFVEPLNDVKVLVHFSD